jgi:arginyl-tRNA synthetase
MIETEQLLLDKIIKDYCVGIGLPAPEVQWFPLPNAGEWGICTSFFQIAANEARISLNPPQPRISVALRAHEIATAIVDSIELQQKSNKEAFSGFTRVEASKGYLNIFYEPSIYTKLTVEDILNKGSHFGRGDKKNERVMVEYAQPNTHHSFHIGHARNAILGEALARIVEFAGFETLRATYPGDIGLGVITVVWAYLKYYQGQEPDDVHQRGQWLLKIYVEANQLLESKPDETEADKIQREILESERREIYRKWDQGDPIVREAWSKTRQWSLDELIDILEMLDIKMDVWFFESEEDEPAKAIVTELIDKGIADDERASGGAVIVKIDEKLGLKKEKYRTNVVLRSDGTTLYLTKDLALAKAKFEKYHVDRSIYVIDVRQSLQMQQAFKILELMGYHQAGKCYHLGYGFVSLPEGAMSARRGRVVLFMNVVDEAIRRVLDVIAEKNPELPDDQRQIVARQVGLGALVYSLLSVDNNKDTIFDMEQALSFDGHTAPYIQNAYVRANSILKKAGNSFVTDASFTYGMTSHELQLIDYLSRFPHLVQQAANEYRPLVIATYAYDLASAFHSFYHSAPVLQADNETMRQGRLHLVAAARQVLANALYLLDIQAPEVM